MMKQFKKLPIKFKVGYELTQNDIDSINRLFGAFSFYRDKYDNLSKASRNLIDVSREHACDDEYGEYNYFYYHDLVLKLIEE